MTFETSDNRPQRQFETEATPGGFGGHQQSRPRLTAKWIVAEDGKLLCQWTRALN